MRYFYPHFADKTTEVSKGQAIFPSYQSCFDTGGMHFRPVGFEIQSSLFCSECYGENSRVNVCETLSSPQVLRVWPLYKQYGRIPWELVRNATSQALAQVWRGRNSEGGAQQSILPGGAPPGSCDACSGVRVQPCPKPAPSRQPTRHLLLLASLSRCQRNDGGGAECGVSRTHRLLTVV